MAKREKVTRENLKNTKKLAMKLSNGSEFEQNHATKILAGSSNSQDSAMDRLNEVKEIKKRLTSLGKFVLKGEKQTGKITETKTAITYKIGNNDTHIFRVTPKLHLGSLLDEFNTSTGDRYVSYFLLNDETNLKGWGVTTASIPNNIDTFKGMPFVITSKKFFSKSPYDVTDHPSTEHFGELGIVLGKDRPREKNDMLQQAAFQEEFRVGNIDEIIRSDNGDYLAFIKIDPKFADMPMPPLVSPAVFQLNPMEPADNIRTWVGMHLAGLDERPAYGNSAVFKGSCNDSKQTCLTQLSASMPKTAQFLAPCTMKKIFNARIKVANMRIAQMLSSAQISSDHPDIQIQNVHGQKKKKRIAGKKYSKKSR